MGISVIEKDLKFVDIVWMGRITGIHDRGSSSKEALTVNFNQIMPLRKKLPEYNGSVTNLKTAIQYAYDVHFGWH